MRNKCESDEWDHRNTCKQDENCLASFTSFDDDEWGNEKNAKVEQLGKRTRKVLGSFTVHLLFLILKFELVFLSSLLLLFLTSCCRVGDKRQDKSGRERERKNRKIYFSWLWKSNSQLDFNFVCVCLSVPFLGDCHCGVWRCQLRFRWLPTLTCRQWRQLQRSVSICKLYVLSPSENQMSFKVNLKHIFYFTFFWNTFPYSFQSLHAIGKVRE